MQRHCFSALILVAICSSCDQSGGPFSSGEKHEIKQEGSGDKPPPKPPENEKIDDPVMTTGTYLVCESMGFDSRAAQAMLNIGCDVHSKSSEQIIDLTTYFSSVSWTSVNPAASTTGVQITQHTTVSRYHAVFTFAGPTQPIVLTVAQQTKINFSGRSRKPGTVDQLVAASIDLQTLPTINTTNQNQQTQNSPLNTPGNNETTSTPLLSQAISHSPTSSPTPIAAPTSTISAVQTPLPDGSFNPPQLEAQLKSEGDQPVVMLRFTDANHITNLRITPKSSTLPASNFKDDQAAFSAALTIEFHFRGRPCSYVGPISDEPQKLITVCQN